MNRLLNELESMKELLLTFELTVGRKDAIISNLTSAMQKQVTQTKLGRIGDNVTIFAKLSCW